MIRARGLGILLVAATSAMAQSFQPIDLVDPDPGTRVRAYAYFLGVDSLPECGDPAVDEVLADLAEHRALLAPLAVERCRHLRRERTPAGREADLRTLLDSIGRGSWPVLVQFLRSPDGALETTLDELPAFAYPGERIRIGGRIVNAGTSTTWTRNGRSLRFDRIGVHALAEDAQYVWNIESRGPRGGRGSSGARGGGRSSRRGDRPRFVPRSTQLRWVEALVPGESATFGEDHRCPDRFAWEEIHALLPPNDSAVPSGAFRFDLESRHSIGRFGTCPGSEWSLVVWTLPALNRGSAHPLALTFQLDSVRPVKGRLAIANRSAARTWLVPKLDGDGSALLFFVWRDEAGRGIVAGRLGQGVPRYIDLDEREENLVRLAPGASTSIPLEVPCGLDPGRYLLTIGVGRLEYLFDPEVDSLPLTPDETVLLGEHACAAVAVDVP